MSLVLVLSIAVIVVLWVRSMRVRRKRWLSELSLPGVWDLRDGEPPAVLELRGELSHGRYAARSGTKVEEGGWRLVGHVLTLEPDDGQSADYDLRMFDAGSIGIDGPGRERHVYTRRRDNVVTLRQRS